MCAGRGRGGPVGVAGGREEEGANFGGPTLAADCRLACACVLLSRPAPFSDALLSGEE